jgi:hypothetical protein
LPAQVDVQSELYKELSDPALSLRTFGKVQDIVTGTEIPYDPGRITRTLQQTVLAYCSEPPRNSYGQTRWLLVLKPRQAGVSTLAANCGYTKAAYLPEQDVITIADTRERAQYLHTRVHALHRAWPAEIRSETIPNREARQLSFLNGSKIRTLSADGSGIGIGLTPSFLHMSELPWWVDLGGVLGNLRPALEQRQNVLVIGETTPAPAREISAERTKELVRDAKLGTGRWLLAFAPWWDGVLNARPWSTDWSLTNEEIRLIEAYGEQGLGLDNLAFRRMMLEEPEFRRDPTLFEVFYPSDDTSCWGKGSTGVIPSHAVERHQKLDLVQAAEGYVEFEPPEPDALYVMGVDPVGNAARDHGAFQILKVYDGEWTQVARYAGHTGPNELEPLIRQAAERYNNARVVVESNGVGQAILALLKVNRYPSTYHEALGRPGVASTGANADKHLSWLIDALLDELVLRDAETVSQCGDYRHDKRIEESATSEQIRRETNKRRRDRHHWDLVSALIMAVIGARTMPRRSKQVKDTAIDFDNIVPLNEMGRDSFLKYAAQVQKDASKAEVKSRPKIRRPRIKRI